LNALPVWPDYQFFFLSPPIQLSFDSVRPAVASPAFFSCPRGTSWFLQGTPLLRPPPPAFHLYPTFLLFDLRSGALCFPPYVAALFVSFFSYGTDRHCGPLTASGTLCLFGHLPRDTERLRFLGFQATSVFQVPLSGGRQAPIFLFGSSLHRFQVAYWLSPRALFFGWVNCHRFPFAVNLEDIFPLFFFFFHGPISSVCGFWQTCEYYWPVKPLFLVPS